MILVKVSLWGNLTEQSNTRIKKFKSGRVVCFDNVPSKLLKQCEEEIIYPLCTLIQKSLYSAIFPTCEKIGKVKPTHKSDCKSHFNNYRPISILLVISKIVERLVHNQLYEYLEKSKFLSNRQFGMRKGISTSHAITYLSDFIRQKMDSGQCTRAVLIDLKKVFDTVDHTAPLSKLLISGKKGNELNWSQDYLFNRKQFVEYFKKNSNYQHITCRVPKGQS